MAIIRKYFVSFRVVEFLGTGTFQHCLQWDKKLDMKLLFFDQKLDMKLYFEKGVIM